MTEEFIVVGYFKVNRLGQVMSISSYHKNKKILKNTPDHKGYERVVTTYKNSKAKSMLVHRLVAIAFIPNPNNYDYVNHIDGDNSNNHVDNLEWCTASYNMFHAWENLRVVTDKMRKGHNRKIIRRPKYNLRKYLDATYEPMSL